MTFSSNVLKNNFDATLVYRVCFWWQSPKSNTMRSVRPCLESSWRLSRWIFWTSMSKGKRRVSRYWWQILVRWIARNETCLKSTKRDIVSLFRFLRDAHASAKVGRSCILRLRRHFVEMLHFSLFCVVSLEKLETNNFGTSWLKAALMNASWFFTARNDWGWKMLDPHLIQCFFDFSRSQSNFWSMEIHGH